MDNLSGHIAKVWDKWAADNDVWTTPISHEAFADIANGRYHITVTCQKDIPRAWYGDVTGKALLGLAAGGGQQMPVFAALGADVTVLDYSDKQLDAERTVAEREHYDIQIIKGDMAKRLPFADESFDIIINPVSVCYAEDAEHVWRECRRVLKPGGVLIAGFGNPFQMALDENGTVAYKLPRNPLKDNTPEELEAILAGDDGVYFSHSLDTLIGGQARAGLCLTDLYEDYHFGATLAPTYIATRTVKA